MKIDSNIKPPVKTRGGVKYPFRSMKPGDSIFLPGDEGKAMQFAARVFQHRNPGQRWVGGIRIEEGVTGYRMWRIE